MKAPEREKVSLGEREESLTKQPGEVGEERVERAWWILGLRDVRREASWMLRGGGGVSVIVLVCEYDSAATLTTSGLRSVSSYASMSNLASD